MDPVRRRCCLSVPASDERKIGHGLAADADEVVFDLEDSVPPESKEAARRRLAAALRAKPADPRRRIAVRVNAPRTPWCHRDLEVAATLPAVSSVVVPKVESAGDLDFVDRLLDGVEAAAGRATPLAVQALVETATGLADVGAIAGTGQRLQALILGYADLGASLGLCAPPERRLDLWLPAQQAVLVAARKAGLQAVDGPHLGVAVDDGFRAAVARVRDLGFDGKWAIHPRQVEVLRVAFTPTDEQVRHATETLAALSAAHGRGLGAVGLDGQMLDEAVAVAARRVLARASEGGGA